MDVSLWDLGRRRQAALLQWRAASINSQYAGRRVEGGVGAFPVAAPDTPHPPGLMARLWARAADSPPEVVEDALGPMRGQVYGMMGGMIGGSVGFWAPAVAIGATGEPAFGAVMAVLGALMSGAGLWVPGYWLRRACRPPVSVAEVEALLAAAPDELERAYLRLSAEVVRLSVAPEAAERVREALRAVGQALDDLPAVVVARASVEGMREEEVRAREEARKEADPVVAASHERRADALGRSADAARRSQILTRRASALREEMLAQIESLRLGLAGFETASGDVAGLAALADAVRSVATESLSVADARMELDASLRVAPPAETILHVRAE